MHILGKGFTVLVLNGARQPFSDRDPYIHEASMAKAAMVQSPVPGVLIFIGEKTHVIW